MLLTLFIYDVRGNSVDSAVCHNDDELITILNKYPDGCMEWLIPEDDEEMGVLTVHLGKGVVPAALHDLVSRDPDRVVVNGGNGIALAC
jgi:hypothetical protein